MTTSALHAWTLGVVLLGLVACSDKATQPEAPSKLIEIANAASVPAQQGEIVAISLRTRNLTTKALKIGNIDVDSDDGIRVKVLGLTRCQPRCIGGRNLSSDDAQETFRSQLRTRTDVLPASGTLHLLMTIELRGRFDPGECLFVHRVHLEVDGRKETVEPLPGFIAALGVGETAYCG